MEQSGVEELQDELFDLDGGLAETATVGGWTGNVIAPVDADGDAPAGELGYSTRLRRLSFVRTGAPALAQGTVLTWRDAMWRVDATEETDEDLLTVFIVPVPDGPIGTPGDFNDDFGTDFAVYVPA